MNCPFSKSEKGSPTGAKAKWDRAVGVATMAAVQGPLTGFFACRSPFRFAICDAAGGA